VMEMSWTLPSVQAGCSIADDLCYRDEEVESSCLGKDGGGGGDSMSNVSST
jgi:hypothetical protein